MRRMGTILGWASLACSLAFWVVYTLHLMPGFPKRFDLTFSQWAAVWAAAIVLALLASTIRKSWQWGLAALIPVANFLIIFLLIDLSEPRGH